MGHTCIHWFRKGLRLHDNPALMAALKDCKKLFPVFVLDPQLHNKSQYGVNRWRFLIGSLKDLDTSLRKLNSRYRPNSVCNAKSFQTACVSFKDVALNFLRLFVVRGKPEDVFPELFNNWKVTKLTYEYDTEPYSLSRDETVSALAKKHNVEVVYRVSHTLYNIER